jgi:hypothetical protein
MNARFFDFASQNQKNGHSFEIFICGPSRQGSFVTGSSAKIPLGLSENPPCQDTLF